MVSPQTVFTYPFHHAKLQILLICSYGHVNGFVCSHVSKDDYSLIWEHPKYNQHFIFWIFNFADSAHPHKQETRGLDTIQATPFFPLWLLLFFQENFEAKKNICKKILKSGKMQRNHRTVIRCWCCTHPTHKALGVPLHIESSDVVLHDCTMAAATLGGKHTKIVLFTVHFAVILVEASLGKRLSTLGTEEMLWMPSLIQGGHTFLHKQEKHIIFLLQFYNFFNPYRYFTDTLLNPTTDKCAGCSMQQDPPARNNGSFVLCWDAKKKWRCNNSLHLLHLVPLSMVRVNVWCHSLFNKALINK